MVLNKAILWLHVHDFDTPISWDKRLKVFHGDAHILTEISSNVHQLDTTNFEGIQILGN
jgi:hypothetical protein